MHRRYFTRAIVAIIVLTAGAGAYVLACQVHRESICRHILRKIDRLALQPPNGMTELEWASVVYWTHNLHCNTIPQVYADLATLRELDTFIDDGAERGSDMATIDGIWDRYAQMSDSGSSYREKYESRRNEIAAAIANEGESYADARSYRDFLAYVRSTELSNHPTK